MSDYLKEEWRDGCFVDEKRKKLWNVELDIIQEIDRICAKYDIKYCILGGALIGAIRHKGFIPWDDDMDIGMLRKDYEKFISVAQRELEEKFFVQTGINDEDYYDKIIRVRDRNTTGIVRKDLHSHCNNGVFIEVYPFDSVNTNIVKYKIQIFRAKVINAVLHYSVYGQNKRCRAFAAKSICNIFGKEELMTHLTKILSMYNDKGFEMVDLLLLPYNCKYKKKDMEETIRVPYEYLKLCIPKGYDACLKTTYGDYMKMPPAEQRVQHHNKVVFYDPYHPYDDKIILAKAEEYFL